MIVYADIFHPRNKRRHTLPEQPQGDSRTPGQRDRDRILYTSAFRRLAEVTQVASPTHSQTFHNRLTHSLQVAQVGKALAQRLQANFPAEVEAAGGIDPDVVEAACLAHDIGHPPFGHTAEEELNKLARGTVGGFEGNAQSFRVVTNLAFKSGGYRGLDLTRATLAAILKYPWKKDGNPKKPNKWGAYDSEISDFIFAREANPPLKENERTIEASLMDWADDVTYAVHDIEDFYKAGLIPMHLLSRFQPNRKLFLTDNEERDRFFADLEQRHRDDAEFFKRSDLEEAFSDVIWTYWRISEPYSGTRDQRSKLRYFGSELIHRYVNSVTLDSTGHLVISEDHRKEVAALKELTWTYVIEAPPLAAQQCGHRRVINCMFKTYTKAAVQPKQWSLFPQFYRDQLDDCKKKEDRIRVVVDLIAGMTEPQAIAVYRQISGGWPASSLEQIIH